MRRWILLVALAACSKGEPAKPALSCKDAITKSAVDPKAITVTMGIRQCELEEWLPELKQCIADQAPGADLESACFSKFPKRGLKNAPPPPKQ